MSEYIIFTQRIAGTLMTEGFRLLRIESNRKYPKLHVFIFEDSKALRQALDKKHSQKSNH